MFPNTDIVHHFHPIAWVAQMKLIFGDNGICVCEARVRAFMRMIRVGEGTGELVKSYDKKKKKIVYIEKDFEEGYTTAFGGHKITDLSKHPEKNYGGSTAAGAYQVMRFKWWELNGEVLDKNFKKTGKYNKSIDYVKIYNIPNYKPESQDKLCVIILKHTKSGLMNLIINGNIEKAIRSKASLIWASLPHTGDYSNYKYKGKLQPATTMKDCLSHYNEFLKEELKGESNLHLQRGFLKEFGFECCEENETISNGELCSDCGEIHIDLRNKMIFKSQAKGSTNCGEIARGIVKQVEGIHAQGNGEAYSHAFYQLVIENSDATSLVFDQNNSLKAIKYMNKALEYGHPLRIGVNHTLGNDYNEKDNPTTDHYVVITGKGCLNGNVYYQYWDVGTVRGESKHYQFKLIDGYKLINENANAGKGKDGRKFTVTQIARNIKDGKIIEY